MATPIKELVKDLTKEDVLQDFVDIGVALGIPADTFVDGDPGYGLLAILSEWIADLWNKYVVPAIRAGFLDFAEGAWLTLAAALTFETDRKDKAFAGTKLYAENRGGGFYTLNPGDIRVQNATGRTFRSVTGGTLTAWSGSGPYPKVLLDFQADEAGSDSNTPVGGIQTTPVSAPSNVFVQTNTSAILGQDEEDDAALVKRSRLSTGPLSPAGPKSAYEYIALSTTRPDGTFVDVTRVRARSLGNGVVAVYLAGASSPTTGSMLTEGSDVFLVHARLAQFVAPVGLGLVTQGTTAEEVSFTLTLHVDRGSLLTAAEAIAAATDAVNTYFQKLPIGGNRLVEGGQGYVFKGEVEAKASESADGIIRATATGDLAADYPLDYADQALPAFNVFVVLVSQ